MTVLTPAQYAAQLRESGRSLSPEVAKVINRAAANVRDDWRRLAKAKNPTHAPGYQASIRVSWARVSDGVVRASVSPEGIKPAKLGTILEMGGPRNAPQMSHVQAAAREVPKLLKFLGQEVAKVSR